MQTLVIAHRGASQAARENTLAAFAKAIEIGADMAELDVRRTADGKLIVFHDPSIRGHFIVALTYDQVNRHATALGFQVPTLKQVLYLAKRKIYLDIELKEAGYELLAAALILKYFRPKDFIITSFNAKILKNIKSRYPKVQIGLLVGINKWKEWKKIFKIIALKRSAVKRYDTIVINNKLWRFKFHKLMPLKNKRVFVWTVDKNSEIRKLTRDSKIAGIITNVPDLALRVKADL